MPHLAARERSAAILKIAGGRSPHWVALHGLLQPRDPDTIYAWLNRYETMGLEGLIVHQRALTASDEEPADLLCDNVRSHTSAPTPLEPSQVSDWNALPIWTWKPILLITLGQVYLAITSSVAGIVTPSWP
jgi:hypothetical protein